MAKFNVQVFDEANYRIANEMVEASDYVEACAEVVNRAGVKAEAKPFTIGESAIGGPDGIGGIERG